MPHRYEYVTTLNAEQAAQVADDLCDALMSFKMEIHPEREDFYILSVPESNLETVKKATETFDPFEDDENGEDHE